MNVDNTKFINKTQAIDKHTVALTKEDMYIMQTILVTGAAGFIGSNLVLELLRSMSPVQIIGLDNMNDYYDVSIK